MYRTLMLLVLGAPGLVSATMVWSAAGAGEQDSAHGKHGHLARATITLTDGVGAAAQLWLPTLERRPLGIDHGAALLKPSGMDNYHLLYAVREGTGVHETALRYHYLNGKPSGQSPAELIFAVKAPLEIVPAPLTREHARYLSETTAAFIIRYQGKPLANQTVMLETSNGTHLDNTSDARGRISFTLPDDFHHVAVGRDNNPPADFFLVTRHGDNGIEYRTSLSAAYHINPRHWQSSSGALWSGLAGFVCGLGVLGVVARRNAVKGGAS